MAWWSAARGKASAAIGAVEDAARSAAGYAAGRAGTLWGDTKAGAAFNRWSMRHPYLGTAALGLGAVGGITAAGGLMGAVSPFGDTGGGARGIWTGGIGGALAGVGGAAGYSLWNTRGMAGRGAASYRRGLMKSPLVRGRMLRGGLWGLGAGALLGAALSSNRPVNQFRGF